MNLQEIFSTAESDAFEANMGVFSGFTSFYSALGENDLAKQLIEVIDTSLETALAVYTRFQYVLQNNPYPEYAHPHDVALAIYLYALKSAFPSFSRHIAHRVSKDAHLWWTRSLGEHILEELSASIVQFNIPIQDSPLNYKAVISEGMSLKTPTFLINSSFRVIGLGQKVDHPRLSTRVEQSLLLRRVLGTRQFAY